MRWIEVNGVALRYELAGGGPQTVVLVHELGGSLDSWDATLPAFQKRFRTLRYDQRGFGQSEKASGTLALADMVADMAALLDALGIRERCHVVGSALGAGIAAAFAARHPSRVERLVVQSLVTKSSQAFRPQMIERANGRTTVPQIFVGSTHIGGCDDLYALHRSGGLDPLLAEEGITQGGST